MDNVFHNLVYSLALDVPLALFDRKSVCNIRFDPKCDKVRNGCYTRTEDNASAHQNNERKKIQRKFNFTLSFRNISLHSMHVGIKQTSKRPRLVNINEMVMLCAV